MIDFIALHSTVALIGIGMSTLFFAVASLADRVDEASTRSRKVRYVALRTTRWLLGPVCGLVISTPLFYLLLMVRAPGESLLTLLLSTGVSAWLFFKYQPFGKIAVVWQ